MAKQRGPVASTFSGRVGNVVGAKLKGGEYVTRSYQPSVKNPNTLRQRVSRLRMATAAKLAAGMAPAIVAGYGKASGSTKMYPRNMFVRDLVSMDGMGAIAVENEQATITYNMVKVAPRIGINATPICSAPNFEEPHLVSIPVSGQPVTDIMPAGKMGLVFAVYNADRNATIIKMVDAPLTGITNVSVSVPLSWAGETAHVYSFHKWIPESGNDIATDTEPWKYPAETSESVYVGTGNIG